MGGADIVAIPQLTPEQARTLQPESSVWVMASAGSGKTQVLTNRVLRLLLAGVAPESILCITFTKAAAAEMAKRIFEELALFVKLPELDLQVRLSALGVELDAAIIAHSRTLFARTLDAKSGLQIYTLHGFCQSLLSRFPLEAGISPHFTTLDDRTGRELALGSMLAVLGNAFVQNEQQALEDIRILAGAAADTRALKLLDMLVGQLSKNSSSTLMTNDAMTARVRQALGLPLAQNKEEWFRVALAEGRLDVTRLKHVANVWAQTKGTRLTQRAAKLLDWMSAGHPTACLEDVTRCFFTDKYAIFSEKTFTESGAIEIDPDIYMHACLVAEQLKALRDQLRLFDWLLVAAAANRLAQRVFTEFTKAKSAKSLLSYDDLIARASGLLHGAAAAWILYKLDYRIEHILLDEAQDTNAVQWEILDQLAAEFYAGHGTRETTRTFFAVGDDKQAIFGFQGSDPEQFRMREGDYSERARAARLDFVSVPMARSFRSAPAILDFVDTGIDILRVTQGASFGRAGQHQAHRQTAAGEVVLWPLVVEPEDEGSELENPTPWRPSAERLLARRLAEQIRAWTVGDEPIGINISGECRRVRPCDILVLLRTRGDLMTALVSEMKRLQIPVAGVDRVILTEQIAVADLLACIQFVLQPLDDLTLATLMRSPFLNVSEEDLFTLAHGRGEQQSLWAALQLAPLSWKPIRDWCMSVLAAADTMPPYEFLVLVLEQLGGRSALRARLGQEIDDPVTMFLDAALDYESSHTPSLQGFFAWVSASDQEIKRDPEAAGDLLRVMTVHGAKGLQAPLVIIADAQSTRQSSETVLTVPTDTGVLPIWCKNADVRVGPLAAAHAAQCEKDEAEYWRLWYVAMTRAADRLYIAGWSPKKNVSGRSWYDIAAATMETLGAETHEDKRWGTAHRYRRGAFAEILVDSATHMHRVHNELPTWATTIAPAELAVPQPLRPSAMEEGDDALRSISPARARGDLVHRWLERLPMLPRAKRADAARHLARDYTGTDGDTLLAQVLALIDDPQFNDIFSEHALCEVPIVARLPSGEMLSGRIDRLLITEDALILVDYKTSEHVPHESRDVPPKIRQQLAAYSRALAQLYPDRPIRCYLLWTVTPKLMLMEDIDQ